MNDETSIPTDPKRRWFEPVTAILMAVSSLTTAWCSYQNSRWSGQSSALETKADKLEREAGILFIEGQQIQTAQVNAFFQMLEARLAGNEGVAKFYADRFGAELKPAYEQWIALRPLENPDAPPHPFVPSLYTMRFTNEIKAAKAGSEEADAKSNITGEYANGYLSITVILASVLFFAGTVGRFNQRHVRWSSLTFALVLFTYAVVRMIMLPVN